jgi:hypothetical protein
MRDEIFSNISKIIERDSKVSTYKFALLRGTIDVIIENSPYIRFESDRAYIPLALLVEKWLLYYYPLLESKIHIPQIQGDSNLAFELQFRKIIDEYSFRGGFSSFYNDIRNKGIPEDLKGDYWNLLKKLRETITKNPMQYIGRSLNAGFYSIYQYENSTRVIRPNSLDINKIVEVFGEFSIPVEYYKAFQILGSFIGGQDSILFKWAEFSINTSKSKIPIEMVLNGVLKSPITLREVRESKKLYENILKKDSSVFCVWTDKIIEKYHVDHVIPFSIWKNNDLWNLLPSTPKINGDKKDKIPSIDTIEKRKDLIIYYWELIYEAHQERFERELKLALLGNIPLSNWKEKGIESLKTSCNYLITQRGFEEWRPKC